MLISVLSKVKLIKSKNIENCGILLLLDKKLKMLIINKL